MGSIWSKPKIMTRDTCIGITGGVPVAIIAVLVAASLAGCSSSVSQRGAATSPAATQTTSTATSHSASSTATSTTGRAWTETTFTQSKAFADYLNAGHPSGATLRSRQAVKVSCRVRGFVVKDGDPWWYRLASPPWNGHYYATSDVFYNTPGASGNPINGVVVDKRVPVC